MGHFVSAKHLNDWRAQQVGSDHFFQYFLDRKSYWHIEERFETLRSGLGGILKNHNFSTGPPIYVDDLIFLSHNVANIDKATM
jgi:hypothetical protein